MFAEAIEDILRDQCTPAVVRAIEARRLARSRCGTPWPVPGFLDLLAPEETRRRRPCRWTELFPVLVHFGRYAVPVPVGAGHRGARVGRRRRTLPAGLLTLAPALKRDADGSLRCPLVPFGAIARACDWLPMVTSCSCFLRASAAARAQRHRAQPDRLVGVDEAGIRARASPAMRSPRAHGGRAVCRIARRRDDARLRDDLAILQRASPSSASRWGNSRRCNTS